jgi:hypothetical protein
VTERPTPILDKAIVLAEKLAAVKPPHSTYDKLVENLKADRAKLKREKA